MGSKSGADEPKLAEGISPMEPTSAAAASLRISPNMLLLSITSNCEGRSVNCIAALSTYMCSSFTAGETALVDGTGRRPSRERGKKVAFCTQDRRLQRGSSTGVTNEGIDAAS